MNTTKPCTTLETHVVVSIDVIVPVNETAACLLQHHGRSNFIFHTNKDLMEKIEAEIAAQCRAQHAEVFQDSERLWACQSELRTMLESRANSAETFNRERALALKAEIESIFAKYGEEVDQIIFGGLLKAIDHPGR